MKESNNSESEFSVVDDEPLFDKDNNEVAEELDSIVIEDIEDEDEENDQYTTYSCKKTLAKVSFLTLAVGADSKNPY